MAYSLRKDHNDILRLDFIGDIGEEDVISYLKEYEGYLETASVESPLHAIINVSQVGKASSAARKAFGEIFSQPEPRAGKSAMIGANRYLRVLAGFVIKATGTKQLRLFSTEEEAVAWLLSGD